MDLKEQELLAETLRKAMTSATGRELDAALVELGWPDMLAEIPDIAVPIVFRLLGETGVHAPLVNDVVLAAAGQPVGGTPALPYAGGSWVVWDRDGEATGILDAEVPLRKVADGEPLSAAQLAAGRRALGWWLVGTGRTMLTLARSHVVDRVQFGRALASFQAVRHRLAETLVALEGAEATLHAADTEFGALLAKAAAGQAALTAARHCGQVLGGIGFTSEHDFHRHLKRAYLLDGLLGSSKELTREAGAHIRAERKAPRLMHL
ncbi:acyl-CoA dehydrogenase [Yinghuangia sp. ASG 101]|uniref:acyl-CoA dehydrogenase family protein n=1 Tax=Yinghuangia sp. ASG 101 TaxID=2896848 RepID=UPI001E3C9238|nr:acyl-CoA dehydrogenase family protein [Yinghuangia sp. ASG 101]UGQ13204.1 acyl-CoA dehydrogenase [Yinghuangia sp. ASG 101]